MPKQKSNPWGFKSKGKKKHSYLFLPKIANNKNIKKINFVGFTSKPTGLHLLATGKGFNSWSKNIFGGDYFLDYLKDKFNKRVKFTIFTNGKGKNRLKITKKSISISLDLNDFSHLVKNLGADVTVKKNEAVEARLQNVFSKELKEIGFIQHSIKSRLNNINFNTLDTADHQTIGSFIKSYYSFNSTKPQKMKDLFKNMVIQGNKETLNQVIKKFQRYLDNKKYGEKEWQKFLHDDVFPFNTTYVESIRETNVNFGKTDEGQKKPDFVWIDIYGFLDVFEIKTPFTKILSDKKDKSHQNYYFSSSAAKAISQIEKYIFFLEKNVPSFENYLKNKTKIPFSILKPKAFLIIGNSKEFENNVEKKKDFRILRRLFKNIEFITFDEMLDNLKNLEMKISAK